MAATCPTSVSSDGQLTSPSPTFAPQRPLCDVKRTHARANAMPGRGPYEPAAFFSANDGGSLHSGPLQMGCLGNWGLPVRLARIQQWCRACTTCTDRSSSKHWLERSSRPDLGSRSIRRTSRIKPSGLPAGYARPASPPAASAVWFASSRPSTSGGLQPPLTSRPTPRASFLQRALQRTPQEVH